MKANLARIIGMILIAVSAQAGAESTDDLRATLFKNAKDALLASNAVRSSVYAPVSYSEGAKAYQKAEETLAEGGNIESIRRYLADAEQQFTKALKATEVARVTLSNAIQARDDAVNAESERFAKDSWNAAEVTFATAATRLEEGSGKSAERLAKKAEEEYRAAELDAIKANYLSETKDLLEQADDAKAKRYAPTTFAKAKELLAVAEKELTENRYDTDRPRNLAQQAKYEARHAIYLAGVAKEVRGSKVTPESLLLQWEDAMRGVGDQLDAPVYFDQGPKVAADGLRGLVSELQGSRVEAQNRVLDQNAQIAALEERLGGLEKRLGGEQESLAQMNALVASQNRIRARLETVETMFSPADAQVLRRGNDMIIRMVGLNFDPGQASIKTDHYPLLGTLREAFALFPASRIVIEGHTDSFGSDELNYTLSEQRAKAVEEYLRSVMNVDTDTISALGYGETKPVANNETADGRTRNRRIDVVILDAGASGS